MLRNWNPQRHEDWGVFASGYNTTEISGLIGCVKLAGGLHLSGPMDLLSKVLEDGDLVCINKGVAYQGYNVDEARTFVVGAERTRSRKGFLTPFAAHKRL